ncbi:MAG: ATP-binding protein [Mucilaginibacter sp.]|uniref:sensor histidine kinase n=1 Tax=Mucilaginibacter sp. TaxID=1882438 RepID=UPI0031B2F339
MITGLCKITLKRIIIFIAVLLLPAICCASQSRNGNSSDSLYQLLIQKNADSVKAKACFLLIDKYFVTDSAKARQYFQLGKRYNAGNKFMQTVLLYYAARLIEQQQPDSAIKRYLQAEQDFKVFKTRIAFIARARCLHDYARLLQHQKDDTESYINILLNKVIPLAHQAGDSTYIGKNYIDVAIGFKNLKEYKKANVYLTRAIDVLKKTHASVEYLASAYHTSSENYSLAGNSVQAKAMLDSMKTLLIPYPDAEPWLDYYAAEGMRLTIAEQFDASLAVINKGIALAERLKRVYPEQRLLLQKFYALYNKKALQQARNVALDLTKRREFMNIATNRVQLFYGLSVTEEGLKNLPEAYKWLKRYSDLNDSISRSNLEKTINSMEIKFRNAENQKKIADLNRINEQVKLDAKNSRLINGLLASASLFLLTVIILVIFFYQNKKKLSAQQEQAKITEAMLQGQEDERIRVARDLHDGLGGMLSAVKINLSDFAKEGKDDRELLKIMSQLDNSVSELRRIAHNMMPEMLIKLGLEASLNDLCESLMSEHLHIALQCLDIQTTIPTQDQITIYRIVQELLTNVVKHANAKNVFLQCSQHEEVFFITIEDDGKGMGAVQSTPKQGIGLNNIKSRVAFLNGKMEILSKENNPGTAINIELYVTA